MLKSKQLRLSLTRSGEDMEEQIEKVKNPAKKWKIFLIFGICGIVIGASCLLFSIFGLKKDTLEAITPEDTKEEPVYSALTGEPLSDKSKLNAPAYCIPLHSPVLTWDSHRLRLSPTLSLQSPAPAARPRSCCTTTWNPPPSP